MNVKLTQSLKKQITKEWNELFPYMGIYKNMWLMNICGPLAVGILLEVKSDRDRYIPTLHIHNLCEEFPVISLGISLETEAIKINDQQSAYLNAADKIKTHTFIPLSGDIVLLDLIKQLKLYFLKYMVDPRNYTIDPCTVLEYMIYLAAWSGQQEIHNDVMNFVNKKIKWHRWHMFRNKDVYEEWYDALPKNIECSEQLRLTVQEQEFKLKTLNLPHRNLII